MKSSVQRPLIATAILLLAGTLPAPALAADTVDLGVAESFAVLGATEVTNVPNSVITGDVGLSPAAGSNYAGITDAQVDGTIYAVDGSGPAGAVNDPALLTNAQNDLTTAYVDAAGRTPNDTFVAADNQLGGQTLTPGVYAFGAAETANLIGLLTLNGNGVFIFQASSSLVTASGSTVSLINGAQSCNVFWQVSSSATLGASSTFVGTVMALTSVGVNSNATVEGRLLARNGAVTMNQDTITRPTVCTAATPPTTTPTDTTQAAAAASASNFAEVDSLPAAGVPGAIPLLSILGLSGLWYGRRFVLPTR